MSHDALSDDYRAWPDDPHELFGVPWDVDERALRRAYNQLIRRFNPERFPEHFMRIRAAYEWLQRGVFFQARSVEWSTENPATPAASPAGTAAHGTSDARTAAFLAHDAWQRALQGSLTEAYQSLKQLHERHSEDELICLKLYWLLRVSQTLGTVDATMESDRVPEDWLMPPLRQMGHRSRAWWLYLQAIEAAPAEALSARCASLLRAPILRDYLRPLLQSRWLAAVSAERWEVLQEDLALLRQTSPPHDERLWMPIVFLALDFTAWSNHPMARELFDAGSREVAEFSDFELEASAAFDRYFNLCETTAWYRTMPITPVPYFVPREIRRLMDVVREFWNRPAMQLREEVLGIVHPWVDDPFGALSTLDTLGSEFPQQLGLLCTLCQQLRRDAAPLSSDERQLLIQPVIERALFMASDVDYKSFRRDMANIGLEECVTVDEIIESGLATSPNGPWTKWCQNLHDDLALRTLLAGVSAYWA